MIIDGFRYEDYSFFDRSFNEEDIGKWRGLVRNLPVPDLYPALTAILNKLAEDTITFERARLFLEPFHPAQREGGITTTVDLFDALNWLVGAHVQLRAPVTLWTEDGNDVFVTILMLYYVGPDIREAYNRSCEEKDS